MIRLKFVGHIRTSIGAEEIELPDGSIRSSELFNLLHSRLDRSSLVGFTKFNTLLVVNDGEAFSPSAEDRLLDDGDTVLMIPFSHGG